MTALDVKQAKQALSWRLAQWGVALDVEGKAASFIDDLVSQGWQMAPERETRRRPPRAGSRDECRHHRGEYADACRLCAVEQYAHPADPEIDGDCTQGRALLAEIRARREGAEG